MSGKQVANHELLLEIGTEELPAQFVSPALTDLESRAARLFKSSRLPHRSIKTYGTPRRLALWVDGVADHQESVTTEAIGPSKVVGFDAQGQPTKAAIGFAASQGIPVTAMEIRTTPKGEYLFAVKRDSGRKTLLLLPDLLKELLEGFTFPKAMRWNDTGARFARPVRWLLALYAGKTVRFQYGGLTASDKTVGHRFLSSGKTFRVKDFKSYSDSLLKAGVVVDQDRRRALILSQIEKIAKQKQGKLHPDEALLQHAIYTVEMPYTIAGSFNPQYLALPKEVLMTSMKEHQGYFSLLKKNGELLPGFVAVTNMQASQAATIRAGNERVLAARLADAKFFFDEDRKSRLETRLEKLKGVTFHQKLGTLHKKVGRVMALATRLADTLGDLDVVDTCREAAKLCKADLVTGMVGEFPTLQGIMGREYALHDGLPKPVAEAIAEQYLPRFAEDAIPSSLPGKVLSLADRMDTLTAFFAVGMVPSGSQDPFALRRHAYAVIRILVEGGLSVKVPEVIQEAVRLLKEQGIVVDEKAPAELQRFLGERFRHYCQEVTKLREDVVDAVLTQAHSGEFDPLDQRARAQALQAFSARPEFEALMIAFKRADNITKSHQDGQIDPSLFQEAVEGELAMSLGAAETLVPCLIRDAKYAEALDALVSLKAPIDAFFVGVMVMAEDPAVRKNRLALLIHIRNLFRRYADFSKIRVEAR